MFYRRTNRLNYCIFMVSYRLGLWLIMDFKALRNRKSEMRSNLHIYPALPRSSPHTVFSPPQPKQADGVVRLLVARPLGSLSERSRVFHGLLCTRSNRGLSCPRLHWFPCWFRLFVSRTFHTFLETHSTHRAIVVLHLLRLVSPFFTLFSWLKKSTYFWRHSILCLIDSIVCWVKSLSFSSAYIRIVIW